MKPQWYDGPPPPDAVAEHESPHPRPDGIRLGRVTVSDKDSVSKYVPTDDWSYGEWISYHHKSRLQPYVGIVRLKVVEGIVYQAVGFCQWDNASLFRSAPDTRFYPVGKDGLPVGFEAQGG